MAQTKTAHIKDNLKQIIIIVICAVIYAGVVVMETVNSYVYTRKEGESLERSTEKELSKMNTQLDKIDAKLDEKLDKVLTLLYNQQRHR